MNDTDDLFIVITPFGRVDAIFAADAEGVQLQGPNDARAHVLAVMAAATDRRGMTMTPETVEPAAFLHFCQPAGSCIQIIPPADWPLDDDTTDEPSDGADDAPASENPAPEE